MSLEITITKEIPKEAIKIREEVFVEEQGFHDDIDDNDLTLGAKNNEDD